MRAQRKPFRFWIVLFVLFFLTIFLVYFYKSWHIKDAGGSITTSVVKVVDGDTIQVSEGKVRLIGIDAPEIGIDSPTATKSGRAGCFAEESRRKLRELAEGKEIMLEKDVSERDKYDRLLRYVFVEGENINELMVREGFAKLATYPPDTKYYSLLKIAEKEAKTNKVGLWGKCN